MELISTYPCLPRTERGKPLVLGPDPKGLVIINILRLTLKNFEINDVYSQHSTQASVAKYSPSRFYIASGDNSGKVRIWDTTQKEHILKAEYQPIGGPIGDLAWSDDSKRLVIGGSGRDKFASAILIDTGSTTGELMGMSRPINSIDLKQTRPYRVITGSEDNLVCFFEGPPFKFKTSYDHHTNFVNSVRYSPTGDIFISAGADNKIHSFDGKTGEHLSEVGPNAHSGGIYAVEFSPKGDFFASVSADKCIKFWKVEGTTITPAAKYQLANEVQNILLSVTWSGETVVACSLEGTLYLFDHTQIASGSISEPKTVLRGHSKAITCSVFNIAHNALITASMDASVAVWPRADAAFSGNCWIMAANESAHKNQVQAMTTHGDFVATVGIDDRLVISSLCQKTFVAAAKLDSQPRSISYSPVNQLLVIGSYAYLYVYLLKSVDSAAEDLAQGPICKVKMINDLECAAINSNGTVIAVGDNEGAITFYLVSGQGASAQLTLQEHLKIKVKQKITALAFSPDNTHLASADTDRTVTAFAVSPSSLLFYQISRFPLMQEKLT
ncbi:WD repeat-containing protein 1 [Cichlidogyrus casuarinus]|uniref:WD repeat-containing protein 1 n=1 Tax=Cichlidogyrus casuarinus TaxID=1844966 RepID=A0ABD2Q5V4_9PLAT